MIRNGATKDKNPLSRKNVKSSTHDEREDKGNQLSSASWVTVKGLKPFCCLGLVFRNSVGIEQNHF